MERIISTNSTRKHVFHVKQIIYQLKTDNSKRGGVVEIRSPFSAAESAQQTPLTVQIVQ